MRLSVATAAVCLCLVSFSYADNVHAAISKQTNIPAEGLGPALQTLAKQRNFQIVFVSEEISGLQTQGAIGQFTPEEALKQLLKGTGFTYRFYSENAVGIVPISAGASAPANSSPIGADGVIPRLSANDPSTIRLAQAPNPRSTISQSADVPTPASADEAKKKEGLEEIVVTGTHIHGAAPLSPVKTITNQDLVDQGYTRLDQAIEQLTENFKGGSSQESNASLGVGSSTAYNGSFGSSVNLFGLGVGTTLILLNGQRLAPTSAGSHVDISGIPASIIDRVEIVEDGASAVYGADAVGGVVNIITRKDYDGFETGARATSIASGKAPNYGGYALTGTSWDTGNVVANFDYEIDHALYAADRSFTSYLPGPLSLFPEDKNYRFYVSGTQAISNQLSLSAQALIPYREYLSYSNITPYLGVVTQAGSELQPSAAIQLKYDFAAGWQAILSGDYSEDRNQIPAEGYSVGPRVLSGAERNKATTGEAHISGPLFNLPGGTVQLALGGQYRSESYILWQTETYGGVPQPPQPSTGGHRSSDSAYAELLLPLIGAGNGIPLVRELAIDAAGRFDHYSDFGSTTNPKVTVKWTLFDGLSIHGTYATSFKTPTFDDLLSQRYVYIYPATDPTSASGISRALLLDGGNPNLEAERSKSFSAGIDYKAPTSAGLSGSLSFFHFDYTQRIEELASFLPGGYGGALLNAAQLGPLITLNPTAAQIAATEASVPPANFLDYGAPPGTPTNIAAIAQVGFINAASSVVSGLSGSLRYDARSDFGEFKTTLDATYLTRYEQQVTPNSQPFGILNQLAQPLKFRGKGMLNWKWHDLAAYGRVNYANAYQNVTDLSCGGSSCQVASWTTVDLGVSYSTPQSADHRLLGGIRVGFDVVNAFNRAPPYALTPGAEGTLSYDPINANPLLRAFGLTVVKKW